MAHTLSSLDRTLTKPMLPSSIKRGIMAMRRTWARLMPSPGFSKKRKRPSHLPRIRKSLRVAEGTKRRKNLQLRKRIKVNRVRKGRMLLPLKGRILMTRRKRERSLTRLTLMKMGTSLTLKQTRTLLSLPPLMMRTRTLLPKLLSPRRLQRPRKARNPSKASSRR